MSNSCSSYTVTYRIQIVKTVACIALFIFTYLLLLVFSLGISFLCFYIGKLILTSEGKGFMLLLLGIGIPLVGLFVLYFILRILFITHEYDSSELLGVWENDQPELYDWVNQIADEIGTDHPYKIYLSHDVNAAVVFDSSVKNLFFPIEKNLVLGMGLINSLTKDELRAIVSHELGHFSQKSLRLGAYMYSVSRVIHNIVTDDESLVRLKKNIMKTFFVIAVFPASAILITDIFSWILTQVYRLVNLNFLKLARAMEFHADSVAARIAGSNQIRQGLLKLDFAKGCLDVVFEVLQDKVYQLISRNIFKDHQFVMQYMATERNIPFENNFPIITEKDLEKAMSSKLVIGEQWDTHPSLNDRMLQLKKLDHTDQSADKLAAISLLQDPEKLQEQLTSKLFLEVARTHQVKSISHLEFEEKLNSRYRANSFPKSYKGYYDNRNPEPFELSANQDGDVTTSLFGDLFSEEMIRLVDTLVVLENDIEMIKQMQIDAHGIKSLKYDGAIYASEKWKSLVEKLSAELIPLKEKASEHDKKVFYYFLGLAQLSGRGEELIGKYRNLFASDKANDERYQLVSKLIAQIDFMNVMMPYNKIIENLEKFRPIESQFKEAILSLLASNAVDSSLINQQEIEALNLFAHQDTPYFQKDHYFEEDIQLLNDSIQFFSNLYNVNYFYTKKDLLEFQVSLLDE